MAKVVKNNLGYLGVEFQFRLIHAFIERQGLFRDLYSIIDQNMFSESYLRTIVGIMKEYYLKHESVPRYEELRFKINEKCFSDEENQYYHETLERLEHTTTEGIDEVEDMAERFFKQQNLVRVANEIKKIASDGDMAKYDECQKLVEEAMAITRRSDDVSSPFDDIEGDLRKDTVITIPTGIDQLDEALGGGLDKGKVGLIMAKMGSGKTSLTTAMCAHASTYRCAQNNYEGYKVLQIVFEDTHRDIHRKYFSRYTQIENCRLNESVETTQKVREMLLNYPDKETIRNNLRILRLHTGEKRAFDIKTEIQKKINEGFSPDLVVIDYFECLKPERASNKYEGEGITMRQLSYIAEDLDIALWIPTQGNRGSISSELITMDQGSGTIEKQQIAQVVMSITRPPSDSGSFGGNDGSDAIIALMKNRSGRSGVEIHLRVDNGTCTITTSNIVDFGDPLLYSQEDNDIDEDTKKAMIKKSIQEKNAKPKLPM